MDIKVTEDISSEFVEIVRDILEDEEFRKLSGYIQHVKTTRLIHSLNVSYISWKMARKLGPGKTVVTILPDTAERYFSTPLFD